MLAQILAIAVAFGSLLLFLTAFVLPKLHRPDDFFWGTVGLFYALILWFCAGQITGVILLAQLTSVILLGWFAWETLRLRQAIADPSKMPDLEKASLVGAIKQRFARKKLTTPADEPKEEEPAEPAPEAPEAKPTPEQEAGETDEASPSPTPEPVVDTMASDDAVASPAESPDSQAFVTTSPEALTELEPELETNPKAAEPEATRESVLVDVTPVGEAIAPAEDVPESEPEPASPKKGLFFRRLFGGKKQAPETSADTSQAVELAPTLEEDLDASAPGPTEETLLTEPDDLETTEPLGTIDTTPDNPDTAGGDRLESEGPSADVTEINPSESVEAEDDHTDSKPPVT